MSFSNTHIMYKWLLHAPVNTLESMRVTNSRDAHTELTQCWGNNMNMRCILSRLALHLHAGVQCKSEHNAYDVRLMTNLWHATFTSLFQGCFFFCFQLSWFVVCNTRPSVSLIRVLMFNRKKGNTFKQHFMIGRFSVVGYQKFTLSILLEILR